jgi:hypothetical protein
MVYILFIHDDCAVGLDRFAALQVFTLKTLDLLHVRGDVGVVSALTVLHLRVKVADLRIQLFDLFSRVLVKVVDHVLFNLKHVALNLGVLKSLLQIHDRDLELVSLHGHVVVFRLYVYLPFLNLFAVLRKFEYPPFWSSASCFCKS